MPEATAVPTPAEQTTTPVNPNASWYGPYEIASEKVDDNTHKVTMTFVKLAEGTTPNPVTIDIESYNACVTKEKSDLSTLRHKRVGLIVADILSIFLKRNILLADYEYTIALLSQSVNDSMRRAGVVLWGIEEPDRTMEDVDKVLKTGSTGVKLPEVNGTAGTQN
jgi:hypothetical protein